MSDPTNPDHYKASASGVECIEITRWLSFDLGNAVKYLWRLGLKDEDIDTELGKALWYLGDEIARVAEVSLGVQPLFFLQKVKQREWVDKFTRHIESVADEPIAAALADMRDAVDQNDPDCLRCARTHLKTVA